MVAPAIALAVVGIVVSIGSCAVSTKRDIDKENKKGDGDFERVVDLLSRSPVKKKARVIKAKENKNTANVLFVSKEDKDVYIEFEANKKKKTVRYRFLLKDKGGKITIDKWRDLRSGDAIKDLEAEKMVKKALPKKLAQAAA